MSHDLVHHGLNRRVWETSRRTDSDQHVDGGGSLWTNITNLIDNFQATYCRYVSPFAHFTGARAEAHQASA
jgi:hypothetical protein